METVVVIDYIEDDLDWEREELSKEGIAFSALQLRRSAEAELIRSVQDADYLVTNMTVLSEPVISSLSRCRLIVRHGIGYDNVDTAAAAARGIPVVNVPDYCIDEVAEQAVSLIMMCTRGILGQIECFEKSIPLGSWDTSPIPRIRRLTGKTVGIVGLGRIGSRVYEMLNGIGVKTLVSDPYITPERSRAYGVTHIPLEEMLPLCDFVTLHTLLNDGTRHLIDGRTLSLMRKDAFLVNTSRGPVVDRTALHTALLQGTIAGAALDVFEDGEPPAPGNGLYDLPNVITTPHYAWASEESGWDLRRKILDEIMRVHRGEDPKNVVNPGYRKIAGKGERQ